jgi:carboxyl-terminal processing protease
MARYYTPSDMNIDKIGIPPDQEVKNLKEFTPEEEKFYVDLVNSEVISKAAEAKPNMTEADIAIQAAKIAKDYHLDERLIRRLIRIQVQKTQPAVLYDLDYDLQLNAAIKAVENSDFANLLKNTKTLRQLQEEVEDSQTSEGSGLTASLK